jgi:hypothetical protein
VYDQLGILRSDRQKIGARAERVVRGRTVWALLSLTHVYAGRFPPSETLTLDKWHYQKSKNSMISVIQALEKY